MKAGETFSARKLWRCGVVRMRGFSGSRSFRLGRLPCREIVAVELFKVSSWGIGGIGGIGDLTRGKVDVDAAAGAEMVFWRGDAPEPEPVGGPVETVGALEEDAPESRLESDNVCVALGSLLNRPCIIARRASENDGWVCKIAEDAAGEPSWLLLPNAERFELERGDKRFWWPGAGVWEEDGIELNEFVDGPGTE